MANITLKPRQKDGLQKWSNDPVISSVSDIVSRCQFWGRLIPEGYHLIINGREYNWPDTNSLGELEKHIRHCIELDEAFYG